MAELLIAISLKPDMSSAHNNLGLIYKESGRYKEAEKEYKEALRIDPKYVDAMNNLAVLYDYEGKHTEAAELLKRRLIQRLIMQFPILIMLLHWRGLAG